MVQSQAAKAKAWSGGRSGSVCRREKREKEDRDRQRERERKREKSHTISKLSFTTEPVKPSSGSETCKRFHSQVYAVKTHAETRAILGMSEFVLDLSSTTFVLGFPFDFLVQYLLFFKRVFQDIEFIIFNDVRLSIIHLEKLRFGNNCGYVTELSAFMIVFLFILF